MRPPPSPICPQPNPPPTYPPPAKPPPPNPPPMWPPPPPPPPSCANATPPVRATPVANTIMILRNIASTPSDDRVHSTKQSQRPSACMARVDQWPLQLEIGR